MLTTALAAALATALASAHLLAPRGCLTLGYLAFVACSCLDGGLYVAAPAALAPALAARATLLVVRAAVFAAAL